MHKEDYFREMFEKVGLEKKLMDQVDKINIGYPGPVITTSDSTGIFVDSTTNTNIPAGAVGQSPLPLPTIAPPYIVNYPYHPNAALSNGTGKTVAKPYVTKIKSRVSIPITGVNLGTTSTLEMTIGNSRDEMIEFTSIVVGKQAFHYSVHRKDLEALLGELTLDKLSKD